MNQDDLNKVLSNLERAHGEFLGLRAGGFDNAANVGKIGDNMIEIRAYCTLLFPFINELYDELNKKLDAHAQAREQAYNDYLKLPKATPSAAKSHAEETTRVLKTAVEITANKIKQLTNEYTRGDTLAMALMSRMKQLDTDRRLQ